MRRLPVLVATVLVAGCGAAEEDVSAPAGERVSGHGLELTLPEGWYGDVTRFDSEHAPTLRAATFPLPPLTDLGAEQQPRMGERDLLVVVAEYGPVPGEEAPGSWPIRLGREHVRPFGGFREPVATTWTDVAGTRLQTWVVAARAPTDAQLAQANAVLATLRHERQRWRDHVDEERGLSASIPPGWAVAATRLTPFLADPRELLSAGTGPLNAGGAKCSHVPQRALEELGPDDALVSVFEFADVARHRFPPRPPELRLEDGVEPESAACVRNADDLGYRLFPFTDGGRSFHVYVAVGRSASEETRTELRRLLASLRLEARDGPVAFADPEVGVSGLHPPGWHRERALTGFVEPREVLALASYPLRRGAEAGECAPDTAREDMPPDGVFVWLLEYRAGVPIDRFPERPRPFRVDGLDEWVSCFPGPGRSWTFREAGRRFQLLVAFGGAPTQERLREVETILSSLALVEVPTPPPPPWADWPRLSTSTPDSMHVPPGWAAAGAHFDSAKEPPPRALFFAANRPLPLLPGQLAERARLPGAFPDVVLARGFPPGGVLLWVLEESARQPRAREYPPIDRDWPEREDFTPVEVVTKAAPDIRWLVASGEWMGHRFSVWIAHGTAATDRDLEQALTAAGTLAVSGCDRGVGKPCVETR